jgi:anti-anti-sigma regulatory factor
MWNDMKKIRLSKDFGSLIITRNAIINLFDSFANLSEEKLILDFRGIEFISRSAAHEYVKQKSMCDKEIREVNISQNVKAMFLLVTRQMKKSPSVY